MKTAIIGNMTKTEVKEGDKITLINGKGCILTLKEYDYYGDGNKILCAFAEDFFMPLSELDLIEYKIYNKVNV